MKNKSYIIFHKAWYYKANDPTETAREVSIQIDKYEFRFKWIDLGYDTGMVPQLQMFDDSFRAIADCPDLFAGLTKLNGRSPSIAQITGLLDSLGFTDCTPYATQP